MAHLWKRELNEWTRIPLVGGEELTLSSMRLVQAGDRWVLIGNEDRVRVNGRPVAAGIRVLRDQDEIAGASEPPIYFSTERLAEVAPMPDFGRVVICPRCRIAIETGTPAVACPGCGLHHHQQPDHNCWTYAPVCGGCPHPTGDVGYRWTPEALVG